MICYTVLFGRIPSAKKGEGMGKTDISLKDYLAEKERFADLVNGAMLHGRQVLHAEELGEVSTSHRKADEETVTERMSDVAVKQLKDGSRVAVYFVENQMKTDYGMPVRVFYNDALEYDRQYRKKQKRNHTRWKNSAASQNSGNRMPVSQEEFLSGLYRDDLLIPVITIVLYWGDKKWKGPTRLKQMLKVSELDEELQQYITDYPIHLIHIDDLKEHEYFKTDIKHMVALNQCRHDMAKYRKYISENTEAFSHMDAATCFAISKVCDSKELLNCIQLNVQNKNGKESVNMCKALEDLKEEGRMEGREEGREEGRLEGREEGLMEGRMEGQEHGIMALIRDNLEAKNPLGNIVNKLQKYFNLDEETADKYIQRCL